MTIGIHRVRLCRIVLLPLLLFGCGGKKATTPPPKPANPETALATESRPTDEDLAEANQEIKVLKEQLEDKQAEIASLEERYLALELEHASTLEEVLRSKSSLRGVQSRALATSRIAEVRVQLQSVSKSRDPEVRDRLRRASVLLDRADEALADNNYSGAAYLAERAGELTRQARLVSEFRAATPHRTGELIPIVPSRELEASVKANLREGPGTDTARIGQLEKGETVTAFARMGDWFQVETKEGTQAWLHRSVVK